MKALLQYQHKMVFKLLVLAMLAVLPLLSACGNSTNGANGSGETTLVGVSLDIPAIEGASLNPDSSSAPFVGVSHPVSSTDVAFVTLSAVDTEGNLLSTVTVEVEPGTTVTIGLLVPSGSGRIILVQASNAGKESIFNGRSDVLELVAGVPVTVSIHTVTHVPQLVSVLPKENSPSVASDAVVSANFNQDMLSADETTFVAQGNMSGKLSGTYTVRDGVNLDFTPDVPFKPGEKVQVTLTEGLQSQFLSPVAHPYVWEFRANVSTAGQAFFTEEESLDTSFNSSAVTSADYDGDGDLDLVVAGNPEVPIVEIYENIDGKGTFEFVDDDSFGQALTDIISVDMDNDGDVDLVVVDEGGSSDGGIYVLINKINEESGEGAGGFAQAVLYPAGANPIDVIAADLDGDGDQDLAVAPTAEQSFMILKNNGDGTFSAPVPTLSLESGDPVHLVSGDLENDGDIDLVVTLESECYPVESLFNNGDGTFAESLFVSDPCSFPFLYLGDLNNDGALDLVITEEDDSTASVLLNPGTGIFVEDDAESYSFDGASLGLSRLGDLDGDGDLDMVAASSVSRFEGDAVSVRLNDGTGNFGEDGDEEHYPVSNRPLDFDLGDMDADLALDVLGISSSNSLLVLTNEPEPILVN